MRSPLPLAALCVSALAASSLGVARAHAPPVRIELPAEAPDDAALARATFPACPAGTLPDGDVCVHLPGDPESGEDALATSNIHRERTGRWAAYQQIPRLPDRPESYDAYRYPVPPGLPGGHYVVSGYDLDRPDDSQRRGPTLHATGHGGVDLPDPKGTPIKLVALEHQVGDADVVYVGPLFGNTVVTRHTVREGGRLRDYVLLFGHLDAPAPGLAPGRALKDGELVGTVGDSGSPELVHLHLEARRVRDGVDMAERIAKRAGGAVVEPDATVVCDPRNVLPLRSEEAGP